MELNERESGYLFSGRLVGVAELCAWLILWQLWLWRWSHCPGPRASLLARSLRPPVGVGRHSSRRRLSAFPQAAGKAPSHGGCPLLLLLQLAVDCGEGADEIEERVWLVLDSRWRKDGRKKRHFGGVSKKKMELQTVPAP